MPVMRLRVATVVLAAFAPACIVGVNSEAHIAREERRFAVTGTPDLRLTTFDGPIEIRAWDRPEVVVEIEKRGPTAEAVQELEVKVDQEGNRIQIEVRRPEGQRFLGVGINVSRSAKLVASVPRQSNLMARTGDGSIRIERVGGQIELRTGDGSVRGIDLAGDVTVRTGDGPVTLEGVTGRLTLSTGDGGVNVAGALAAVRAETGDGSITLRAERGSAMAEDWSLTTGDGGVTVYLPAPFDAVVDAHTGDGVIRSDLEVSPASGERRDRRTLRGSLGDGGRLLRIRTGDGSISLRQS